MKNVYAKLPEIEGVRYVLNKKGKPIEAIVELDFPIDDPESPYEQFSFRRMKAKDTLTAENTKEKIDAGLALYACLANVPIEVIYKVDTDDLDRISEAVAPLMGKLAMQGLIEAKAQAKKSLGEI